MNRYKEQIFFYFLLLVFISTSGQTVFQNLANPFAILGIYIVFALAFLQFFIYSSSQPQESPKLANNNIPSWLYPLVATIGGLSIYEELRKAFVKYDYNRFSDVIPQLQAQANWLWTGQFPYQNVVLPTHVTYPVYMPFHFAPLGFQNIVDIDVRWIGYIFLLASIIFTTHLLHKEYAPQNPIKTLFASLLFIMPLWAYVLFMPLDIAVSFETIIASYYLLLGLGLATKNFWLIGIGIILCVLSRYTLVFWLPLFAVLLWFNQPRKYSYAIWGSLMTAILVFYILPFFTTDPLIFLKSLEYHNSCAIQFWVNSDEYTYLSGTTLAPHLKNWLPGSFEQNLRYARSLQGSLMLIISFGGAALYQFKLKNKLDIFTYSLAFLFVLLFTFFVFSPMTFGYYLLTPLTLASIMTWIVLAR